MPTTDPSSANRSEATPVACALQPDDLLGQQRRWKNLLAVAAERRMQTTRGLHIAFRETDWARAELETLVATERRCCPWATWTVNVANGELNLRITSDDAVGRHAIHEWFQAEPNSNS